MTSLRKVISARDEIYLAFETIVQFKKIYIFFETKNLPNHGDKLKFEALLNLCMKPTTKKLKYLANFEKPALNPYHIYIYIYTKLVVLSSII